MLSAYTAILGRFAILNLKIYIYIQKTYICIYKKKINNHYYISWNLFWLS